MDEADTGLLKEMVGTLNKNRSANWIDLHNLRIIKYGSTFTLIAILRFPGILMYMKHTMRLMLCQGLCVRTMEIQ